MGMSDKRERGMGRNAVLLLAVFFVSVLVLTAVIIHLRNCRDIRYAVTDLGAGDIGPYDINDRGEILLYAIEDEGPSSILWKEASRTKLAIPEQDGLPAMPLGFDTCGNILVIVGQQGAEDSVQLGWDPAEGFFDLGYREIVNAIRHDPAVGSRSIEVWRIRNSSTAIGITTSATQAEYHKGDAFFWTSSMGYIDLGGDVGGFGSAPKAANEKGIVVGARYSGPKTDAFVWSATEGCELIDPDRNESSFAWDINHKGQIVGAAFVTGGIQKVSNRLSVLLAFIFGKWVIPLDEPLHAFLWEDSQMIDLNRLIPARSGWELTCACAINNRGAIAGCGILHGEKRAFLLDPTENQTPHRPPD